MSVFPQEAGLIIASGRFRTRAQMAEPMSGVARAQVKSDCTEKPD